VIISRSGFGGTDESRTWSRVPAGHPEGYLEAFANLYSEIAAAIADRELGRPAPECRYLFPTVEDGVRGVRFMLAALESSRSGSRFVAL
jgi:hypothetical protein